ncbi:MAG: hypothetical protein K0R54_6043 [Clostridiaceae bacterium]|nr:hypothetical protein [Clostridiaceae bacterium]
MSTGKLTLQKYVTTPGVAARGSKGAAKHVGEALDLVGGIAGVAATIG